MDITMCVFVIKAFIASINKSEIFKIRTIFSKTFVNITITVNSYIFLMTTTDKINTPIAFINKFGIA